MVFLFCCFLLLHQIELVVKVEMAMACNVVNRLGTSLLSGSITTFTPRPNQIDKPVTEL